MLVKSDSEFHGDMIRESLIIPIDFEIKRIENRNSTFVRSISRSSSFKFSQRKNTLSQSFMNTENIEQPAKKSRPCIDMMCNTKVSKQEELLYKCVEARINQ